jgi:hypothetical protein
MERSRERFYIKVSPPRAHLAARLLSFIHEKGGKLFLDASAYHKLRGAGLERCEVNRAVDDLYDAALIDVNMVGQMPVLRLSEGHW